MKVKILLVPLMLVIIVTLSVWLVYPAYSNGKDGVRENYAKLKTEQKKLAKIKSKIENVKSLSAQLASLKDKDILYTFVPENMKEDEITNSLNVLASNFGLLFFESMINQPAKESSNEKNNDKKDALPKIQDSKTEIKLIGNYEKIKEFLDSLGELSRSNNFEKLEISRNDSGVNATVDANTLLVNAVVDFNILKKSKLNEYNGDDLFLYNSNLETKIIDEIKNQRNTDIFQLSVDQKGKSNLFSK